MKLPQPGPPAQSDVVRADLPRDPEGTASLSWAVRGVGTKAHGLVEFGEALLTLGSEEGALLALDPWTGEVAELWKVGRGSGGMRLGEGNWVRCARHPSGLRQVPARLSPQRRSA
jgi:hypothetical protein